MSLGLHRPKNQNSDEPSLTPTQEPGAENSDETSLTPTQEPGATHEKKERTMHLMRILHTATISVAKTQLHLFTYNSFNKAYTKWPMIHNSSVITSSIYTNTLLIS